MINSFEWTTTTPDRYGVRPAQMLGLWEALQARQTSALLVICGDTILEERYASGWTAARPHYTASLAKALVGGLSLLVAMDMGLIDADDLAARYIPHWRDDPVKSQITIRHLATHTSGIEDAELTPAERAELLATGVSRTEHHLSLPGWKGAFWRRHPDPFTVARDQAPVVYPPGTGYAYSNPGMAMLAYAVTASLRNAGYRDIRTLLRQTIMQPIGVEDETWSIGYGEIYDVDGLPLVANWGGASFTPRSVARMARLMLHHGAWQERQILNPARVREALMYAGTPVPDRHRDSAVPVSGLGWYTNVDGVWPNIPRDAFAGAGAGHQLLLVVPSLDLIVVRNGEQLDDELPFWEGAVQHLFSPLLEIVTQQPPYPPSPTIQTLAWAPPSSIVRLATGNERRDGSDNWPLAWAADGHQYTAYGDGFGFAPLVPEKLGLGFAVIIGDPESGITGLNIRSTGENRGMGAKGKKASGLLMIDDTLYLWVRNADGSGRQAQLAWSQDYARTWTWADWQFAELGYPTFIHYGPGYTATRDHYVYIVSPDHPSAYVAADHFVLLRVPRDAVTERDRYEFFVRLDENGQPIWSADIADRGAVFRNPGRCSRSGISFSPGLQRYLWWQQLWGSGLPGSDPADVRFHGGLGVYDAPEPWGPWTTAYFTPQWDVGPGESGSFPPKWMSKDGNSLYLVFSGDDNFCVRQANVVLREPACR